jgi:hypothetical protein
VLKDPQTDFTFTFTFSSSFSSTMILEVAALSDILVYFSQITEIQTPKESIHYVTDKSECVVKRYKDSCQIVGSRMRFQQKQSEHLVGQTIYLQGSEEQDR